jgi:general nucleoside transport system permease protein
MAEAALTPPSAAEPNPIARTWLRISPALVPLLAVLTALIITIPFMIFTGGKGDVRRGLNIVGLAYGALVEGATGLAVNDQLTPDNLSLVDTLAHSEGGLTRRELRGLANDITALAQSDIQQARGYGAALARFPEMDDEALTELGSRIPDIIAVGSETLLAMRPLITELAAMDRAESRTLAERFANAETLSAEDRAAVEAAAPSAADLSDADLLRYMKVVNDQGVVKLEHLIESLDVLNENELAPESVDAQALAQMAALQDGTADARALAAAVTRLDAAGITDLPALAEQMDLVRELYNDDLLTEDEVATAIENELPTVARENLLIRRPGNRLLVDRSSTPTGIIYSDNSTPDDPADDVPDTAYLRLGNAALIFIPANLETMLVRAIPFVIAGLAVALGFKAGLFNIGAEGQLYIGAILAVWVGFSPLFAGLPMLIHLPLVIMMGIIGGALWGAIPGALKAYTGAHEVIVTIMLNFVAVLLVDWLIKSTNPILLLDPAASTPRTPFLVPGAQLPAFNTIPPIAFLIAGVLTFAVLVWPNRDKVGRDPRYLIRPVVWGLLVAVGGLFLQWVGVRGRLHVGFLIMIFAVWFTDWFLNRTTLGFELRTVGANPDAAKYAGMNVKKNIIFAMALSGALAGLAGVVEISGVQRNMQPAFFSGLGFDAIAVALLARTNPRNMIPAGLLWGSLLAGAGLMQVRAEISIDLVKIIQALIIMFVAADAIIRYLWRVPKPTERTAAMFSKGWGG